MKTLLSSIAAIALCVNFAQAQPGPRGGGMMGMGGPRGPQLSGGTAKLFGDNSSFSATMEMQTKDQSGGDVTMPGKIAFSEGKSRFEMDMSEVKGGPMSPQQAAQMKAMGMSTMVIISRPDKKATYLIFPGLQAYLETPMTETEAGSANASFKLETTELDKEKVDGHPCIKNKAVVTDDKGNKEESTVWNATDLKNFPVKIVKTEDGKPSTLLFKDVKLAKPEAAQFDPPSGFERYDNMMTMMMKRMGGQGGPPARP
jgi:hypothetical protein